MAKQNQGFRKDLNLEETTNETAAINNLAGAGIANDLRVIQNNLRNTSTLSCDTVTNGFFSFPNNEFVFTDDDIVEVSANVTIGATTLTSNTEYFICNSNTETQFKLSTTPSTIGINTIIPNNVSVFPIQITFIRKDAVTQDNIINFIQPQIQDTEFFSYLSGSSINDTFNRLLSQNETAKFFIERKYRKDEDRTTSKDLNYEGTVSISDPVNLNINSTGLSNAKSPGVYIGDTRAFSSDNNPWSEDIPTSALLTNSTEVSIAELNFADNITISGIAATSATSVLATTFTHKLPAVINGETYYILMLGKSVSYESLTYVTTGNLAITGNGSGSVNIFKTSGGNAWNNQAYSTTPFTAPCTIEFNKQAASGDNGASYAMIGWNSDPLTNASYDTIDYASYPYRADNYQVYHNGSLVQNGGTWSTSNKFYIVYGTDGFIRHYNGSKLLYSVNYGTGRTVYLDSSFYSVNSTFGGFSNIRVTKFTWNGENYE
jgi:hypothetical protein